MTFADHVRLMARYNQWMNGRLYDAVARLDPAERAAPRGAFFGSVMGTLNHLMVADLMWISRFAAHPAARPALDGPLALPVPTRLDETLFTDLDAMRATRDMIDAALIAFTEGLDEPDFDVVLSYRRANGAAERKPLGPVLSHVFNHQTHHRGQITTLMSQAGIDVGVTDVNALVPSLA